MEATEGERVGSVAVGPDAVDGQDRFSGLGDALEEFTSGLRTGRPPQGECRDNLRSLAMVTSALESAARGERVAVRLA